jgi:outer membrane protein OmpA-like peptidoglycan-associated protein
MRNLLFLLFIICNLPIFSQEYLGVNQSNFSGALGADFNPANIADNRMKVDLFVGASVTAHNNYIYMNTSNMPGGWMSSFTGTQSADTTWRNQPWFEKIIGSDSADYYMNLGQGNYFTTDPADLGNKPYRGIVNLNVDLFNLMVTLNRKSAIGLQVKHRTLVNIDHIAPELVTLSLNSLEYSSLWDLDLSDQLLNVSFNSWIEYNLSYAQVLKEDGEHFVKAGGKLKFLQGLGAAYINTDNVDYNFQDADFANYIQGDFSYGYSQNLGGYIEQLDSNGQLVSANYQFSADDFALQSNLGLGIDIGGVYEWRPKWKDYKYDMDGETNLWRRDQNKYKLKVSFAINDIGGMRYTKGDLSRDFTANLGVNSSTLQPFDLQIFDSVGGLQSFDNLLDYLATNDSIATNDVTFSDDNVDYFRINLPTNINLALDYHIWNDFYVDARAVIGFQRNNDPSKVRMPSSFALTPRYDYKYIGVSLPLSYSGFYGFRTGLGIRFGPLVVGVADIKPLFAPGKDKNIRGANIYAGVRFGLLNKHLKDDDKDKVSNRKDDCKDLAGVWEFKGCPDTDGDGIKDLDDLCPNAAGPKANEGCPDTDKDGLFDYLDECPEVPGPKENRGCPWPDTDEDGILDKEDDCPNNPGPKSNNGCPYADTDADGVLDKDDDCVNTPGPKSNNGCPIIQEEEQEILNTAFENLEFESGKDIIKEVSFPSLEELANLLIKKSEWKIAVAGYTDNVGSAKTNLILSKKRSQAISDYLEQRGVNSNRIIVQYFGEEKPVADNDTKEGRQQNRRVEMTIIFE